MYCLCHVLLLWCFYPSSSVGLLFCGWTYFVGPPFPNAGFGCVFGGLFFNPNCRFNSTGSLIPCVVTHVTRFSGTPDREGTSPARRRLQAHCSARPRLPLPDTRGRVAQGLLLLVAPGAGRAPGTPPPWGPPSDGHPRPTFPMLSVHVPPSGSLEIRVGWTHTPTHPSPPSPQSQAEGETTPFPQSWAGGGAAPLPGSPPAPPHSPPRRRLPASAGTRWGSPV